MRHSKRRRLTVADVAAALRLRNVEPVYGFSSNEPLPFVRTQGDVFFVDDEEVDLRDVIDGELPRVPLETTMALHWLAINGVQPRTPQNPPAPLSASVATSAEPAALASSGEVHLGVAFRPRVKHVLSREMQLYYEYALEALAPTSDAAVQNACLASLARDPGLQQLLPYFSAHLFHTVSQNTRNLPQLWLCVRLMRALLENPHFGIEAYLHQLMPALLTCIVGKHLCGSPDEDHWALRDDAADLLSMVYRRFGGAYESLPLRITETLRRALTDPARPLPTQYGALVAFRALGPAAWTTYVAPLADTLRQRWEEHDEPSRSPSAYQRTLEALNQTNCGE
ncbi:hypothetical protein CDCA_CDCA04G1377 [Cyanidium caldarium]|uniref:TAF6 C-terminal HEAT repeat domain-containing protein n=1 Tax=Cyanidium caldarium TaxID=2771 RepID=A0AAV9ISR2_CYACA|nr:hypothetical protein CDCA_CDCA04G1377 [Cyanidium caldarium]